MTKTKKQIIHQQTYDLLELISRNLSPSEFKDEIAKLGKLKYASVQNAIRDTQNIEIDNQIKEILNDIAITVDIGNVKTRSFQRAASKNIGISEGEKVRKTIQEGENPGEKHLNVWMKKRGATINFEEDNAFSMSSDELSKTDKFLDNYAPRFSFESDIELESRTGDSDDESEISDIEDNTTQDAGNSRVIASYYDGKGEDVCEYIATNLSHIFLDSEKNLLKFV